MGFLGTAASNPTGAGRGRGVRSAVKISTRVVLPLALASALVGVAVTGPEEQPRGAVATEQPIDGVLQLVHSLPTQEAGVPHPTALGWSPALEALTLADQGSPDVWRAVSTDGTRLGKVRQRRVVAERPPASVPERPGTDLRGASRHPETGNLYTYDATSDRLLELDGTRLVASYDASDLDLDDVRGVVVAPSNDHTDHASVLSVYLVDKGTPGMFGEVVEATFATDLALAASVTPISVREVDTSDYDPPSPDPSGLAYMSDEDRLMISDGEVEEMSIFEGDNLFATNRLGELQESTDTQPWTDEPVGVAYDAVSSEPRMFVSDDDQKEVFEVTAGGDGTFGTSDDDVRNWDAIGNGVTDPEGVGYDAATDSLWYAGGSAADVHHQESGNDGVFGTSDDVWRHYDAATYGMRDPEGIGFDSVRGTVVVMDSSSRTIYELDRNGALLNTIDVRSANMVAAAGLAVAPASNGSSRRTYYVVARGVDNNVDPNENDGKLYEITADLPPVSGGNMAPSVDAGPDLNVTLPSAATLDGTATDDDLPDPPGALTTSWAKVSGPGSVTFADPGAVDTTATFSSQGTYVLQLSADDGALTQTDQVVVVVAPAGGVTVLETTVAAGSDDAEENPSGSVGLSSTDLEITTDRGTQQVVGVRFADLGVPRNAEIVNAYVQFQVDEDTTGVTDITIRAEDANNTPTYAATNGNITGRSTTSASVTWAAPNWPVVGAAGADQRTPDLSPLLQAVVNRTGWSSGNAFAVQFSGTGSRVAESADSSTGDPVLHVEYTNGGGGTPNEAPVVDAGADQTVQLPAAAVLDGTVTDDGLPDPPGATSVTWSMVSGPGTVTFGDAAAVDTTASFSNFGTYRLRLTADDDEKTGFDEVVITVQQATTNQPPAVSAGPDLAVELPGTAALDGTVTDDGLPDPPGAVSVTWSTTSGPGTVTFGDAAAVDTTASFSTDGTYVLRLTADDGGRTEFDQTTVTVSPEGGGGGTTTVERRVQAGSDDAEEAPSGNVSLGSSDLELTESGARQQVVGIRFADLQIPNGAQVTQAWVQFETDEVSNGTSDLTLRAETADDAPTYTSANGNVTSRDTGAGVSWAPAAWPTPGESGAAQRTPNLAALIQPVVDRPGWTAGNALAIQVSGTGTRTAEAYRGSSPGSAPLLHVEYTTGGGGGPTNQAPTVDAGPDLAVTLPATASLDGTVSDDGLPTPPTLVTTWSQVSGPGTVTFGDASAVDTTASFSGAGTYQLRLTADDGVLTNQDSLTVVVSGAGGVQTLQVAVAASSDDAEGDVQGGATDLTSSDLEMTHDRSTQQVVGVRFSDVQVPAGSTVTNAWIQFTTDEVSSGTADLTIRAETADDAATYTATTGSVTGRDTTTQSVAWTPPAWTTVDEAGAAQRTPDLQVLAQAVLDRPGWASGNALAFQISGTGTRTARSYDRSASLAAVLHVEFTTP